MSQCGRGKKRILFMGPSRWFPSGRWRRPCEVNTDTVYFPELCKPSVALHKVKESNLLYRFTELRAAIPHIWCPSVPDRNVPLSVRATWCFILHIQISAERKRRLWQMSKLKERRIIFLTVEKNRWNTFLLGTMGAVLCINRCILFFPFTYENKSVQK